MRFKIDENLPAEIAELLKSAGYDAKTVNEQRLQGAKDNILVEICNKEGRVLVTLDTDFSDIKTYPPENYSGIIVLAVKNQAKSHIVEIFRRAIPHINEKLLAQRLWIAKKRGYAFAVRTMNDKTNKYSAF